ncbi:hypothetical protein FRC01_008891 [Tulasnella sp. 417]|nr:hypothetical protein FRC01_008891 [Tulasnella sp. 417]
MWPAVKSEKRLVFVDVQVPEQTGAFYIGTMIRLPEYDRFLATSEVGALSSSVLDELVDLYDDATSTVHRATTRERLKTGDLQVPCIRLEYAQADFVLDIDMVLIDAAVRARATLFGRNLDSSGRPRPQEENQNHRQKREETTIAMEKDVDNLQQLARASQPQQAIVKEMINQPKQELGPSSVEPRMSFDFTVETQQAKNYLHPV